MIPSPATLLAEFRGSPGRALLALGMLITLALTPAVFAPGLYDDFTLPKQASLLVATALVLSGLAWDGEFLPRQPAIRALLLAWTGLLVLSFLTGIDRRGSILGYYQYRQGLLTQVAYISLFLGASKLTREEGWQWLGIGGSFGLAAVTLYTVIQAIGQDPVNWWTDTSARAIGTIGNANELAAYAVIALALCGFGARYSARTAGLCAAAIATCSGFVVVESESRSGLLALATVFVAFPLASTIIRQPRQTWGRRWLILGGGIALGAAISALAGGAAGTASRVQGGFAQQETSGSTRMELWKGTISTIAAAPLLGFGPDGLYLAFPQNRPADLTGAFLDYDMIAQSSHNAALDVAANQGLPALAALVALLGLVAFRTVRLERREPAPELPYVCAVMVGYVALVLVNPVSLAPHALFFVLAGALEGRTERQLPAPHRSRIPSPARLVLVSPAVLALAVIAVLMPLADLSANRAWSRASNGDFAAAARDYEMANDLLPFERTYAAAVARSWLAAGVEGGAPSLQTAVTSYESFDADFGFASSEAIGMATARIGLREGTGLAALIDRGSALNPHGVSMTRYSAVLRLAAENGGFLRYSQRDHWVFVVPGGGETQAR